MTIEWENGSSTSPNTLISSEESGPTLVLGISSVSWPQKILRRAAPSIMAALLLSMPGIMLKSTLELGRYASNDTKG